MHIRLYQGFCGNYFPRFGLYQEFRENWFSLSRHLQRFCKGQKLIFSTAIFYGFETNLIQNQYFFTSANDRISDGLEDTKFRRNFISRIFAVHQLLEKFAGIDVFETPILKNFTGINFHESIFSESKKEI